MTPVIIESPFAGCVPLNRAYLQAAIRDCLRRGETPYASHQMLTWALRDEVPEERELGISAGLAMRDQLTSVGGLSAFYVDLGWSSGMLEARKGAGLECDMRSIVGRSNWELILLDSISGQPYWGALVTEALARQPDARSALLDARDLYLRREVSFRAAVEKLGVVAPL